MRIFVFALAVLAAAASPAIAGDLVDEFYDANVQVGKRQAIVCVMPAVRTPQECEQDHVGLYEKVAAALGWQQLYRRAKERNDEHAIRFYEAGYSRSREAMLNEEGRIFKMYPLPEASRAPSTTGQAKSTNGAPKVFKAKDKR